MGLNQELYSLASGAIEMSYVIGLIILLVGILLILKLLEKRLRKMLMLRRMSKNLYYNKELKKLSSLIRNTKHPQKTLDAINELARDYFKDAFNMSYSLEYTELMEEFKKRKKIEGVSFCKLMTELNYSGREIRRENLKTTLVLLEKIAEKNKIVSKQERQALKNKVEKIETTKDEKTEKRQKTKKSFFPFFKIFFRKKKKSKISKQVEKLAEEEVKEEQLAQKELEKEKLKTEEIELERLKAEKEDEKIRLEKQNLEQEKTRLAKLKEEEAEKKRLETERLVKQKPKKSFFASIFQRKREQPIEGLKVEPRKEEPLNLKIQESEPKKTNKILEPPKPIKKIKIKKPKEIKKKPKPIKNLEEIGEIDSISRIQAKIQEIKKSI